MVVVSRLSLAMLKCLAGAPLAAQAPTELMFPGKSGCYERQYSTDHLAGHPAQRVTEISLTAEGSIADPMLGLWVHVTLRGAPGGSFEALAYCENEGGQIYCGMEGDAGGFTVAPAKIRERTRLRTAGTRPWR
jgi:hypothetical protein